MCIRDSRGAVAGKDGNIFSIAFLVPHTQIGLEGQGGGAGASSPIGSNDGDPAQAGKLLRHFNQSGRLEAVIIGHKNMHGSPDF